MKIDIRKLITEEVLKKEMSFLVFHHIDEEMSFKSHETFDSSENYDTIPFEFTILKEKQNAKRKRRNET